MSESNFARLLSPLRIGNVLLRNRIVFTAHDSSHQVQGQIGDAYIAYQVARARGGAGLQILSAASIDENSATYDNQLQLFTDDAIPGYRRMAEAVHEAGGTVFGQLLHSGRDASGSSDGSKPVTYSASAVRNEKLHTISRALSISEIRQVIRSFAAAAKRVQAAGLDGVEICASHGYLPAQFLTESMNCRADQYGGSPENRFRFLHEICAAVRADVGESFPIGVRLSAADLDNVGLEASQSLDALQRLEQEGIVDFFHLVVGSGATLGGRIHIVAPMALPAGYVMPFALQAKKVLKSPLIATGRFNTPQLAEEAITKGAADAIGMTRAMICDPDLGKKVEDRRIDDIRACIACDQACIGHLHKGYHVSCIQFPESGRETSLGIYPSVTVKKRVLVVGAGPAGMKAASVAALRGHSVILCEASNRLGGQANIAAKLPGRAEFGGIVTNLTREVELAGVDLRLKTVVNAGLIASIAPEALVIATGGKPTTPDPDRFEGMRTLTAEDVLSGVEKAGQRVVVADALCDWVGIGVSLQLAGDGHDVTLAVTGTLPGETIPLYVRDELAGRLFDAGVKVVNYSRLYGADKDSVYFEHIMALKPVVLENVDTLVVCDGVTANRTLEQEVEGLDLEMYSIGDCLTPRTAEEAVLDGLKVGRLL
ncbi:FAD-dependent oxidoreductase [Mesorhizobium sp. M1380]|uniref:oxidoreductase n=1 Tax=Mesorhizobium sp. M1380 TaxID=2957093 RepID=UPI00333753FB